MILFLIYKKSLYKFNMLIINKKTKSSRIIPYKKVCIVKPTTIPQVKIRKKRIHISEEINNDIVYQFELLLRNAFFNTEKYTVYINYENIKNDFKKLIYNKLS
jgi:hypothetical protein